MFSLVILAVVAFTFIFPFYWIITGAFKSQTVAIQLPPQWFPTEPTLDNFIKLFKNPALNWFYEQRDHLAGQHGARGITASLAGYKLAKSGFGAKRSCSA